MIRLLSCCARTFSKVVWAFLAAIAAIAAIAATAATIFGLSFFLLSFVA
jgi:hypothetical protein